ncbi:hypothetical protein [Actinomyces capricornis]|uniref:Uncharacterized protein n=1 Tax=Actinomyces capricornis TaxID=2755559 RepID=A0ABM7UB94_9ACTO|nr:hypothetical protein [Actinomyces capricornis]BDA64545.1 hypothetical protein MANAM107_13790 [Actinomyces capricornis]
MKRREFSKIAALTGAGLLVAPAAWASSNPGMWQELLLLGLP